MYSGKPSVISTVIYFIYFEKVNSNAPILQIEMLTRMWANAQRDSRPAEHRLHPLFNAAKFG